MAPPNMFSVISGQFLASGKANRQHDVTPTIRLRILDYCRQSLVGHNYPAHQFYPDLAAPISTETDAVRSPALELART
jgi:hypothetical protein